MAGSRIFFATKKLKKTRTEPELRVSGCRKIFLETKIRVIVVQGTQ